MSVIGAGVVGGCGRGATARCDGEVVVGVISSSSVLVSSSASLSASSSSPCCVDVDDDVDMFVWTCFLDLPVRFIGATGVSGTEPIDGVIISSLACGWLAFKAIRLRRRASCVSAASISSSMRRLISTVMYDSPSTSMLYSCSSNTLASS